MEMIFTLALSEERLDFTDTVPAITPLGTHQIVCAKNRSYEDKMFISLEHEAFAGSQIEERRVKMHKAVDRVFDQFLTTRSLLSKITVEESNESVSSFQG